MAGRVLIHGGSIARGNNRPMHGKSRAEVRSRRRAVHRGVDIIMV